MPNSAPEYRLNLASYPLQLAMTTRYSDMDSYAHLNNGAIGRLYEDGRAKLHLEIHQDENFFRPDAIEKALIIDCHIQYLAEGHFPDGVITATGIGRIGKTSYQIDQALFQNQKCIGLCESIMVRTAEGKPSEIQGELRQRLEALLIKP
jgi:acyl-CoA thioester hydrolase|tara:strand:+ start:479 stop:925 length:447 start_codon:yes stop_codon:yes gene_type:complete